MSESAVLIQVGKYVCICICICPMHVVAFFENKKITIDNQQKRNIGDNNKNRICIWVCFRNIKVGKLSYQFRCGEKRFNSLIEHVDKTPVYRYKPQRCPLFPKHFCLYIFPHFSFNFSSYFYYHFPVAVCVSFA